MDRKEIDNYIKQYILTPYDKFESIVFNSHVDKELEDIEGAIVFNLDVH